MLTVHCFIPHQAISSSLISVLCTLIDCGSMQHHYFPNSLPICYLTDFCLFSWLKLKLLHLWLWLVSQHLSEPKLDQKYLEFVPAGICRRFNASVQNIRASCTLCIGVCGQILIPIISQLKMWFQILVVTGLFLNLKDFVFLMSSYLQLSFLTVTHLFCPCFTFYT